MNAKSVLDPEDLRLASRVFDEALGEVGDSDLHPYAIRRRLSQSVMDGIRQGERDPDRLRKSALGDLRRLEAGSSGAGESSRGSLASIAVTVRAFSRS